MSIKEDLRAVFKELSPILAGFKLALIVISYFGLGSVAKWVISHWYPFTRWLWDGVCNFLSIPAFPVVVKDSLTALVFFIPLGVTAAIEFRLGSSSQNRNTHRLLGAFFGFLFLIIICKDAITSIGFALSAVAPDSRYDGALAKFASQIVSDLNSIPKWTPVALALAHSVATYAIYLYVRKSPSRSEKLAVWLQGVWRVALRSLAFSSAISALCVMYLATSGYIHGAGIAVVSSIAIMFAILAILSSAVIFAPRKLYITAGACLAFVAAAICFELLVATISFIESAPV